VALCACPCRRNFTGWVEPDRPNEARRHLAGQESTLAFRAEIAALATEWVWLETDIAGARKQLRSRACLPISI
jgi:hypothetical protein